MPPSAHAEPQKLRRLLDLGRNGCRYADPFLPQIPAKVSDLNSLYALSTVVMS
jgi:hypothetical protein